MKHYTSKILLFGEHIIIKGAKALAMPLPNFSGNWKYASENDNISRDRKALMKEKIKVKR